MTDTWEALERECKSCRECSLCETRKNVVFGVGSREAEVLFIGEGPGASEDEQGEPFVGRAGKLLDDMLAIIGLRRGDVYIANIVKCRPPGNRNPEPETEASACIGYLKRQIALVKPKAIVLLGAVPLLNLLGVTGIMRHRGNWLSYKGIPVMPTFHPAYLLRFERFPAQFIQNKRLVWQDLQAVMELLKKGAS
jgi:DNA polymerase